MLPVSSASRRLSGLELSKKRHSDLIRLLRDSHCTIRSSVQDQRMRVQIQSFSVFFAVKLCYAESLNERRRCICHLCAITCTCSSRRVLCLLWVKDRASSIMRPTRDAICLFRCILQKLCRPITGFHDLCMSWQFTALNASVSGVALTLA